MLSQVIDINEMQYIPSITKTIAKRLKKEYEDLINCTEDITIKYTNNKEIVFIISKIEDASLNVYSFTMPPNYPFSPPRILINDKTYGEFLNIHSIRFKKVLRYLTGIECLCCHSYNCRDNWSPALSLNHIIQESNKYRVTKNNIKIKLLADKIKDKYLIDDIDLDSWLFDIKISLPANLIYR